jgi:hypothetical protein
MRITAIDLVGFWVERRKSVDGIRSIEYSLEVIIETYTLNIPRQFDAIMNRDAGMRAEVSIGSLDML